MLVSLAADRSNGISELPEAAVSDHTWTDVAIGVRAGIGIHSNVYSRCGVVVIMAHGATYIGGLQGSATRP